MSLFLTIIIIGFVFLGAIRESTSQGVIGKSNVGCPQGPYDPKCPQNCNSTCSVCDSNEECIKCSQPGLQLPECTKSCLRENFGLNCKQRCSLKCLNRECDPKTGDCTACREVGYKLPTCTLPCVPGTFGRNCQDQCSTVCKDNCDRFTGFCKQCKVGNGPHCSLNCLLPKNRNICSLYCPQNCYGWCNTTHKTCHCSTGFKPPHCIEHCDNGTYGSQCKQNCSANCRNKACNPITGECASCIDGYVGRWCTGKCIDGLYGPDCAVHCPQTCFGRLCHHETGYCYKCDPGYTGQFCNDLCENGKYGDGCSLSCPPICLDSCDPITGGCFQCTRRYHVLKCKSNCSNNLKRNDQFLISFAIIILSANLLKFP